MQQSDAQHAHTPIASSTGLCRCVYIFLPRDIKGQKVGARAAECKNSHIGHPLRAGSVLRETLHRCVWLGSSRRRQNILGVAPMTLSASLCRRLRTGRCRSEQKKAWPFIHGVIAMDEPTPLGTYLGYGHGQIDPVRPQVIRASSGLVPLLSSQPRMTASRSGGDSCVESGGQEATLVGTKQRSAGEGGHAVRHEWLH